MPRSRFAARRLVADRYLLESLLEDVDGAQTWSACDLKTGFEVRVHRPMSGIAEASAAARTEAALGRLHHPVLPAVLDTELSGSDPYVVTSPAAGEPLGVYLARNPAASRILAVCAQVAEALSCLHGLGLAHGRVGADLVSVDADGRAWLSGFKRGAAAAEYADPDAARDAARWDAYNLGLLVRRTVGAAPACLPPASADRYSQLLGQLTHPDSAQRPTTWQAAAALLRLQHEAELAEGRGTCEEVVAGRPGTHLAAAASCRLLRRPRLSSAVAVMALVGLFVVLNLPSQVVRSSPVATAFLPSKVVDAERSHQSPLAAELSHTTSDAPRLVTRSSGGTAAPVHRPAGRSRALGSGGGAHHELGATTPPGRAASHRDHPAHPDHPDHLTHPVTPEPPIHPVHPVHPAHPVAPKSAVQHVTTNVPHAVPAHLPAGHVPAHNNGHSTGHAHHGHAPGNHGHSHHGHSHHGHGHGH